MRSRGITLLFLNFGARWLWICNATLQLLYLLERDPLPSVQAAGWAPGPVWKGTQNLATNGSRTADRPLLGKSLYRLRYPGPHYYYYCYYYYYYYYYYY
jgi:hypothetical protein